MALINQTYQNKLLPSYIFVYIDGNIEPKIFTGDFEQLETLINNIIERIEQDKANESDETFEHSEQKVSDKKYQTIRYQMIRYQTIRYQTIRYQMIRNRYHG